MLFFSTIDYEYFNLTSHTPFCVKKCGYCDFYSVPNEESLADDFISALEKEWSLVRKEMNLENPVIQTLFFRRRHTLDSVH